MDVPEISPTTSRDPRDDCRATLPLLNFVQADLHSASVRHLEFLQFKWR
jgi:hypothetical protein